MKALLIVLALIIGAFYYFILIPNFNDCREDGRPLRRCIGHLIK